MEESCFKDDQIRSNKNTPYTNKVDSRKWIIEKLPIKSESVHFQQVRQKIP